jgi:hypothetical protein
LVKSVEDAYEKVKRAGPNPLKLMDPESEIKPKKVILTPAE